jgi:RimJ/RimL family protein N-acetyltransferase
MNIQFLSNRYTIRDLLPQDADVIYEVLKSNTIFYQFHPPIVTVESILEDMEALPPNKGYEDKHYIGFFGEGTLVAVMDLIDHYPQQGTVLLGFFAMNANLQSQGIGTDIISDSVDYLTQEGFTKVRLGIDKVNPQSKAFWLKNDFSFTGEEYESDGSTILVMERKLYG